MDGRCTGMVLLLVGVLLLLLAMNVDPPVNHIGDAVVGRLSPGTVLFLALGTIGVVGGLVMMSSHRA